MTNNESLNATNDKVLFWGINAEHPVGKKIPVRISPESNIVYSDLSSIPEKELEDLYQDGYYGEQAAENSLINRMMISLFQIERQFLTVRNLTPGKVLDIGCGDGTYLENLPKTWKKFGFEPSEPGQKALKQKGISLFKFEELQKHKESFDLITLWHSLEHIKNPKEVLVQIRELMKPSGRLFVSIPNINSLQAMVFRGKWFHLDPTRHLFHYTPKTARKLIEDEGFEVQHITLKSFEYGVYGWWQSLLNLLPTDFNMAYKILKARKKYQKNGGYYFSATLIALFSLPFLAIAVAMTLLETLFSKGGVIHITVRKKL
ncbi:MAG: class I SAM-dependent methyltransferase [Pseudobdellovibrionaceae bacterium]